MASESVNIIIEADNKASAQFQKVGQDLDAFSKKARETGRNTKASVEIVGSLANAFGGSAIGAFAQQLGGLTEKVSAFSDVAKTGTAGALAFKVGIVAAAGAVTYSVATKVASWWFEIDKVTESAKQAEKQLKATEASLGKVRQTAFSQAKEDLGLIRDPREREQATNEAAAKLEKQAKELDRKLMAAQAEVVAKQQAMQKAWDKGRAKSDLDIAQSQLDNLKSLQDELSNEAQSLRDLTSERAKSIEARKAENAAKDKSDVFLQGLRDEIEVLQATTEAFKEAEAARTIQKGTPEKVLKIEASRNATPEDQGKAEALLKEREQLRAKIDEQRKAEIESEQAAKKEEDAIKRISELEKRRTIEIEARRVELEKGREAAAAYRLEQDGLSKATAERLAAQEESLRKDEEMAGKAKNLEVDNSPQQAVQGRLLQRGNTGDPAMQMLNKLDRIAKILDEQKKEDAAYRRQKNNSVILKTVNVP